MNFSIRAIGDDATILVRFYVASIIGCFMKIIELFSNKNLSHVFMKKMIQRQKIKKFWKWLKTEIEFLLFEKLSRLYLIVETSLYNIFI